MYICIVTLKHSIRIPISKRNLFSASRAFKITKSAALHPIMYCSPFTMQTFISLLFFHLQGICSAKDHPVRMRLRVQRRSLVDSPLGSEAFLSSGNHPTSEEVVSKYELTTPSSSSRNILVDDKSDPEPEQIQQSWLLGQDPVDDDTLLLTRCTTNKDGSDQQPSLLPPSAKFQRRQTGVPNACPAEWVTQPPGQQQNVKLDAQGQGQGSKKKKTPDGSRPTAAEGEEQRVTPYPNALELYRLDTFGQAGNSHSICDGFVGHSIPMCAPSSLQIPVSPPNTLAPSRFCKSGSLYLFRDNVSSVSGFSFPPTIPPPPPIM